MSLFLSPIAILSFTIRLSVSDGAGFFCSTTILKAWFLPRVIVPPSLHHLKLSLSRISATTKYSSTVLPVLNHCACCNSNVAIPLSLVATPKRAAVVGSFLNTSNDAGSYIRTSVFFSTSPLLLLTITLTIEAFAGVSFDLRQDVKITIPNKINANNLNLFIQSIFIFFSCHFRGCKITEQYGNIHTYKMYKYAAQITINQPNSKIARCTSDKNRRFRQQKRLHFLRGASSFAAIAYGNICFPYGVSNGSISSALTVTSITPSE